MLKLEKLSDDIQKLNNKYKDLIWELKYPNQRYSRGSLYFGSRDSVLKIMTLYNNNETNLIPYTLEYGVSDLVDADKEFESLWKPRVADDIVYYLGSLYEVTGFYNGTAVLKNLITSDSIEPEDSDSIQVVYSCEYGVYNDRKDLIRMGYNEFKESVLPLLLKDRC